MAEAVGLALGVAGIAGLFTSCIENFDLVIRAKTFSEEFELLCTQLSLQQIRLVIWGETLGLVPSPDGRKAQPFNHAIERPDIKPAIISSLYHLRDLLSKSEMVTGRYTLREEQEQDRAEGSLMPQSRGMSIFQESFQKFKDRIRKNQKCQSTWKVTRWAVHDYQRFEKHIDQITKLLDALESITSALGVLQRQQSLLVEEIGTLSDVDSLNLLQQLGASADAPASLREASETASIRLTHVTSSSRSFYTAKSQLTQSVTYDYRQAMLSKALAMQPLGSSNQPAPDRQQPSQALELAQATRNESFGTNIHKSGNIPQHQRWMAALIAQHQPQSTEPLWTSSNKDSQYGGILKSTKSKDDEISLEASNRLVAVANEGRSLARRMFLELRNIRGANVPFISAVPVGDLLDKILASIEGPPGTPYEGGIFWITVRVIESRPPLMRFHTKIYHPNIDPSGKICADYATWWRDANHMNHFKAGPNQRALPWFSDQITNQYSLGPLLVAICGLLASPNIEDPLVPEIAEKYCTDYAEYCHNARLYTKRYAHILRPDEASLLFPSPDEDMLDPIYSINESGRARYSESLFPERSITDTEVLYESIPSFGLGPYDLSNLLRQWFPEFDGLNPLDYGKKIYTVALPRTLTDHERQKIHRLRSIRIDDQDSDSGDLSKSSNSKGENAISTRGFLAVP